MAFGVLFDALFYGNAQHNRLIRLDTPLGEDWLVPMYAKGRSKLGRDYEFVVVVASSYGDRIDMKALIAQPVTLWLQQSDGDYLPHHGYVKSFSRLGSDGYPHKRLECFVRDGTDLHRNLLASGFYVPDFFTPIGPLVELRQGPNDEVGTGPHVRTLSWI